MAVPGWPITLLCAAWTFHYAGAVLSASTPRTACLASDCVPETASDFGEVSSLLSLQMASRGSDKELRQRIADLEEENRLLKLGQAE
ncbi:unnamed protein product, partial [Polarella glacialis]